MKHIIILLCILFMRYICFSEIIIERKYRQHDFSKEKVLYIPIQLMSIEITDTVEIRDRSDSTGLNVYVNVARLWDAYIKLYRSNKFPRFLSHKFPLFFDLIF